MRNILVLVGACLLSQGALAAQLHHHYVTLADIMTTQSTDVASMSCSKWLEVVDSPEFTDADRIQSANVSNQLADTLAPAMASDFRSHQTDPRKGILLISTGVYMFCQSHHAIIIGDAVIDTVGVLDGKGADPYANSQHNPVAVAP